MQFFSGYLKIKTFDFIKIASQKIKLALLRIATTKLPSDLELLGIKIDYFAVFCFLVLFQIHFLRFL